MMLVASGMGCMWSRASWRGIQTWLTKM